MPTSPSSLKLSYDLVPTLLLRQVGRSFEKTVPFIEHLADPDLSPARAVSPSSSAKVFNMKSFNPRSHHPPLLSASELKSEPREGILTFGPFIVPPCGTTPTTAAT